MTELRPAEARPIDALLAAHAAGALTPALDALVRTHLHLKRDNRGFVTSLETLAASTMVTGESIPLAGRDARLAAIFGAPETPRKPAPVGCDVIPSPLASYLGHNSGGVNWRSVMPGLKEHRVDGETSLLWIAAGRKMPHHTHGGLEVTLVLRGAFRDETGFYARGDVSIGDDELDHRPVADESEDCVCFVVNDGPLKLTGPVGRWFEMLRRH